MRSFILVMFVLAVLDILTTRVGIAYGAHELNPLMQTPIMTWWGIGIKLFLTLIVCLSITHKYKIATLTNIYLTNDDPDVSTEWLHKYLVDNTNRTRSYIRYTCIIFVTMMSLVVLWNTRALLLSVLPEGFFQWLGQFV